MGHELSTVNGRTSMMYVGEVPWHGLGQSLDAPATARETIQAAGLDYDVKLSDLTTSDGIPIPSRKAVVRTDTNDVLGVVGNSYVPVQNRQAFGFLDAIAADGGIRYHTAGALQEGRADLAPRETSADRSGSRARTILTEKYPPSVQFS